jgi:hypothetical protein
LGEWSEREIKAYPPFGNKYVELKTGLPVEAYRDWPNEGSPKYAPLTEEKRNKFLSEKVDSDVKAGYSGEFLDDVNWSLGFRDWEQSKTEIEPEQEEEADLVAGVREKIGQKALFEMNSQFKDIYPLMKEGNTNVAEALETLTSSRRSSASATSPGLKKQRSLQNSRNIVSKLHAKGIQIVMTGAGECAITREEFEYQLATYFLVNAYATNQHAERPKAQGDYINGNQAGPDETRKISLDHRTRSGQVVEGLGSQPRSTHDRTAERSQRKRSVDTGIHQRDRLRPSARSRRTNNQTTNRQNMEKHQRRDDHRSHPETPESKTRQRKMRRSRNDDGIRRRRDRIMR